MANIISSYNFFKLLESNQSIQLKIIYLKTRVSNCRQTGQKNNHLEILKFMIVKKTRNEEYPLFRVFCKIEPFYI